jgi:hypothetical protein
MLKAYSVTENVSYEVSVLVFAENANQAKNIANNRDEMDSFDYMDMRATRAKYADGHENDSERELWRLLIKNGWWYEIDGHRIDSDNLDEMIEREII